jgi:hypothetical protein
MTKFACPLLRMLLPLHIVHGINTKRRSISELQPHRPHKYSPSALDGLEKSTRCIHSLSVGNDEKPHALVASPEEIAERATDVFSSIPFSDGGTPLKTKDAERVICH